MIDPMTIRTADVLYTQLVPPSLDARVERTPEDLDALTSDIARRGLIYPIIVVSVGEQFEIIDGATRWMCCGRLNWSTMPCRIYPTKDLATEGIKYASSAFHTKFSPADEAIFFHELLTHECEQDVEKLCALVNRNESYVLDRLDLVNGDEEVLHALRRREIGVGVAKQLNKVPDESWRRYYLRHAIKDGAKEGTVSRWVQDWRGMFEGLPPKAADAEPAPAPVPMLAHDVNRCYICQRSDPRFIPRPILVHDACVWQVLDPLLERTRGGESGGE